MFPSPIHERLLAGDRYWHAVIMALISVVLIGLVFSTWRIIETNRWLQEHRDYIRSRDERWEKHIQMVENHIRNEERMIEALKPDVRSRPGGRE